MKNTYLITFTIFIVSLSSSGCAGINLNNLETVIAGEASRTKMLPETVQKYHRAIYWKDSEMASQFVEPEIRASFLIDMAERSQLENIVESKIQSVDIEQEANSATVRTVTKYFEASTRQVKIRHEKEYWKFDGYQGGWLNSGVDEISPTAASGIVPGEPPGRSFRGRLGE